MSDQTSPDWDLRSAELARAAISDGSPTRWFEELYAEGAAGRVGLPWDRGGPLPPVVEYFDLHPLAPGTRALVVGCGLGVDSEYLGALARTTEDCTVTAFDISATAIEVIRSRHPDSPVDYRVADIFDLPGEWSGAFDLVVEIVNVQALPLAVRARSTACIAALVAPGGRLLVVENVRGDAESVSVRPPWAFTTADLDLFGVDGLRRTLTQQHPMTTTGPAATQLRWLVEFVRPTPVA